MEYSMGLSQGHRKPARDITSEEPMPHSAL
jgi:hypothetical protein